jgi:hypothetical protein
MSEGCDVGEQRQRAPAFLHDPHPVSEITLAADVLANTQRDGDELARDDPALLRRERLENADISQHFASLMLSNNGTQLVGELLEYLRLHVILLTLQPSLVIKPAFPKNTSVTTATIAAPGMLE